MSSVVLAGQARAAARPPQDRRTVALQLACAFLLLISLLAWRSGTFFAGEIDPVILGKSAMGVLALLIAVHLLRANTEHAHIGLACTTVVALYLAVAVIGGAAGGTVLPDLVLAVRVALVLATVVCLAMASGVEATLFALLVAMGVIGVALAASGVGTFATTGRLYGTVLPVNPNQIAALLGPPALALLWRMVNDRRGRFDPVLLLALLTLTYFTGSRTGLIALVVGMVIVVVMAPRMHASTFVCLVAAVPLAFYAIMLSPLFDKYFGRSGPGSGSGSITTLNSRTIAWNAAFSAPMDFWQHWFGGGLAVKTVAVSGTYWDAQVLDSSWVSAFVQAGYLGMILLGVFVVTSLVTAVRARKPYRALFLAIVVYASIRSILETGLLDSYVLFVIILLPTVTAELRPRAAAPAATA